MPGAVLLVARSFSRSWQRHRLRAGASLAGVVIGIVLATAVSSVTASVRQAVQAGTAVNVMNVDVVAAARSAAGMDLATVRRLQAAAAPSVSAPLVRVNTRLVGSNRSGLLVVGATPELAELAPSIKLGAIRQVPPRAGSLGVVVGAAWAHHHHLGLGAPVPMAGPRGVVTGTVTGLLPGALPNGGALAVGSLEQVGQAFARPDRVDLVGFRMAPGDRTRALAPRLRAEAGGAATVGSPSLVTRADTNSYAVVRQLLGVVGFVGVVTAATVVFLCWRLLLDDERANVAKLRLNGVGPRQLVLGSALVFAAAAGACAVLGIPLGLAAARGMTALAVTLVRATGLAGAPRTPGLVGPVVAGLGAALAMSAVAWALALRSFLRIDAIEAIRGLDRQPRPGSPAVLLAAGLLSLVGVGLGVRTLPRQAMAGLLLLGMAGAVLLAMSAPALVGRAVTGRDSFGALALGREFSRFAGRRSAMVAVFSIAVLLSITLTGVAATLDYGLRSSLSAWVRADLWVNPANPGDSLRDERFSADIADRVKAVPGVERVIPFALMPEDYRGTSIQLWSWDTKAVRGLFRFHVQHGVPDGQLEAALDAGQVAVSSNFAARFGVHAGDDVTLPTVAGSTRLHVGAVVRDYTSDNGIVFSSLATYRAVTGDDRIYSLPTMLVPGADRSRVAAAITKELGEYPSLLVWTSRQEYDHIIGLLGQALAVLRMLALTCFVLAALVAATTAAASLAARRRALALTQLVGAPARMVRRQIGAECLLIGALAWAVALPTGLLCIRAAVKAMGALTGVLPDPRVPADQIALTLPLTVGAAFLAVWLPSRRLLAADVMPAIRYE